MPTVTNSNHDRMNFYRGMLVDAVSGATAGTTCFVFEGLKNRLQRGEITPRDFYQLTNGNLIRVLHPKEAFRGVSSFAGSVALNATAGLTFSKIIRDLPFYDEKSEKHQLGSAVAGGMFGGIFSTGAENMIVVQQELKSGPVRAWSYMITQGPTRPFVGLRELMIREAGFIGSVLYFGPKASQVTLEKTNSEALALLSGVGVGIVGATITHPADTLATWRQKHNGTLTFIGGAKDLYEKDGVKTFFRGVGARIWLFTGCFLILENLRPFINEHIDKYSDSQSK